MKHCSVENCLNIIIYNKENNICKKHYFKQWNQKPEVKAKKKKWEQNNIWYRLFYLSYRRFNKLKATPKWIDKEKLKEFYLNCPKGYTVDHIIPLKNENICGLNVPWNLQYLTRSENSRKNNKFDGTYNNQTWKNGV